MFYIQFMTFEKFLDNYRKFLVTKGKSSSTIKLYLRDITLYSENSKNSGISQQHLKTLLYLAYHLHA